MLVARAQRQTVSTWLTIQKASSSTTELVDVYARLVRKMVIRTQSTTKNHIRAENKVLVILLTSEKTTKFLFHNNNSDTHIFNLPRETGELCKPKIYF